MLGRHYASHFLSRECTYSALVFHARRACTPYSEIEISHSVFPTQNMHTFFHRHRESTIHLLSTARTPCTRSIKVHPIQDVSCQVLRLKALRGVRGGLSRKSSSERIPERVLRASLDTPKGRHVGAALWGLFCLRKAWLPFGG